MTFEFVIEKSQISNLKSQISNLKNMTFEEFFAKKRIDLAALGKAEPGLLSEFKTHFVQMGEKSFDHTKKYWFNKLRLQYHLVPEPKAEKVVMENQLAEQTITEALVETSSQPANVGFKPRFKAGMAKPAEPALEKPAETTEPQTPPPAKVGFTPRFKAGVTKPAPQAEKPAEPAEPASPATALGFKPKFKMGVTKPAVPAPEQKEEPEPGPEAEVKPAENPAPALGFKPKFKAGVTRTATTPPEQKEKPKEETPATPPAEDKPAESSEPKPANLGFKPRFNTKPKGEQ